MDTGSTRDMDHGTHLPDREPSRKPEEAVLGDNPRRAEAARSW
jgi:hypothetical protein